MLNGLFCFKNNGFIFVDARLSSQLFNNILHP